MPRAFKPAAITPRRRFGVDTSGVAVEKVARIVCRISARRPPARIPLRADSGFAREARRATAASAKSLRDPRGNSKHRLEARSGKPLGAV